MKTADFINSGRQEEMHPGAEETDGHAPLLNPDEANHLRSRWQQIQGGFVDEPRTAVQQADELVASTIQRLAEVFAEERSRLENGWSRGEDVSTEDLRQALRRYRSFFERMTTAFVNQEVR